MLLTADASRRLLTILCTGILLSAISREALADDRCDQLVKLHRQYAGVELTSEQQHMKVQLVAWYKANCRRVRHSVNR
jgi:uncharacterized protein YeaC (DUF1315 family)